MDASAVVDLLLGTAAGGRVRRALTPVREGVTVAHLDAEVLGALARLHRDGRLDADEVDEALSHLAELPVTRLPIEGALTAAAWAMRANVAARDALYVAAAVALDAGLVTTDGRLARSVGGLAVELPA